MEHKPRSSKPQGADNWLGERLLGKKATESQPFILNKTGKP
jgi:hypothetical protein